MYIYIYIYIFIYLYIYEYPIVSKASPVPTRSRTCHHQFSIHLSPVHRFAGNSAAEMKAEAENPWDGMMNDDE